MLRDRWHNYPHKKGPQLADEENNVRIATHNSLARLMSRFSKEERGSAYIEWAFVAPVLIFFLLVFIELCMIMFTQQLVEGGVKEASRWGITGQGSPTAGKTREQYIAELINESTLGLIPTSSIVITTKVYPRFSDVGNGEPFTDSNGDSKYTPGEPFTDVNLNGKWDADQGADGAGSGGDIVEYKVQYKWNVISPMLWPFAETGGKISYSTSVVVKNEPF